MPTRVSLEQNWIDDQWISMATTCGPARFVRIHPWFSTGSRSSGHIPGCDRQFVFGEAVLARVKDIIVGGRVWAGDSVAL